MAWGEAYRLYHQRGYVINSLTECYSPSYKYLVLLQIPDET